MTFRHNWKHFIVRQTNSLAPLLNALLQLKTPCLVSIVCQCTPADSGAQVHTGISAALGCVQQWIRITTQGMKTFPTLSFRLSQNIWCLDKSNLYGFAKRCASSCIFSSSHLNYLMHLTNLHFSPSLYCNASAWERPNAVGTGALFQCLFIFSIICVSHLTPTVPCDVVSKHFCILCSLHKPCDMNHVSEPNV